jgi:DNA-binding response OmpR family regulator
MKETKREFMSEAMPKILVVEDDRDLAQLAQMHLADLGFQVALQHEGPTGLEAALGGEWDLIILDLNLPGLDGLELCRRLRARNVRTPVLMLTARSTELDRVLGLEVGADDYLTKPFSIRELQARAKAILRRAQWALPEVENAAISATDGAPIQAGELFIDSQKRKVMMGTRSIVLTAKEFDLLLHFARHPGRVWTRDQLLDAVWGTGYAGYEHTVNSHINRLRTKIEDNPAEPRYLLTVWGVGYKFVDSDELK